MLKKPFILIGLSLAHGLAHSAFDRCPEVFTNIQPPKFAFSNAAAKLKAKESCMGDFALVYSGLTKTPILCMEKISRETLYEARKVRVRPNFIEGEKLNDKIRSSLDDYAGSGFDKAQCASTDNRFIEMSAQQTYSLTNVFPGLPALQRGPWAKVEEDIRLFAKEYASGFVYVVTGLFFEAPVKKIGKNQVWVPSVQYKFVRDLNTGKSWGVWMKNKPDSTAPEILTESELEKRTGIDF